MSENSNPIETLGQIQGELLNMAHSSGEFERLGGKRYLAKLAQRMQAALQALRQKP